MEATRCPLTDEWIKKLWYIYTMEYYSAIKGTHLISSNEEDEPRTIIQSEVSQKEKDKDIKICSLTHIYRI